MLNMYGGSKDKIKHKNVFYFYTIEDIFILHNISFTKVNHSRSSGVFSNPHWTCSKKLHTWLNFLYTIKFNYGQPWNVPA